MTSLDDHVAMAPPTVAKEDGVASSSSFAAMVHGSELSNEVAEPSKAKKKGNKALKPRMEVVAPPLADALPNLEADDTLFSDSEDEGMLMTDLLGSSLVEVAKLGTRGKGKAIATTEAEMMEARASFFADLASKGEKPFVEVKTKKKSKGAKKKGKKRTAFSSQ